VHSKSRNICTMEMDLLTKLDVDRRRWKHSTLVLDSLGRLLVWTIRVGDSGMRLWTYNPGRDCDNAQTDWNSKLHSRKSTREVQRTAMLWWLSNSKSCTRCCTTLYRESVDTRGATNSHVVVAFKFKVLYAVLYYSLPGKIGATNTFETGK